MIAPIVGEAAILGFNLFSRGLPLMLRATRRDSRLRERYAAPLKELANRRTILRLERLEGFASECRLIDGAVTDIRDRVLIIWGQPDPYFRREDVHVRTRFPSARLVRLPGAGHFAAEDAADRVAEEVHSFLR